MAELPLTPEQRHFLPPNVNSIAEAQFYPDCQTRALLADDRIVGFVMWGRQASGIWKLFRLMITAEQQRRGYGKAATVAVLDWLRDRDIGSVEVSWQQDNAAAERLYTGLGFVVRSRDGTKLTASLAFG